METQVNTRESIARMSIVEIEALLQQELPESTRIDALLQLVYNLSNSGNTEKIPAIIEELTELNLKRNDLELKAQVDFLNGWYHMMIEKYTTAFELMSAARDYGIAANNKESTISVLRGIAELFIRLGFYEKALEIFEDLFANDTSTGEGRFGILLNLGNAYQYLKRYEEAIVYTTEALAIAERLNHHLMLVMTLNNLVRDCLAVGKLEDTLTYLQRSDDIVDPEKDKHYYYEKQWRYAEYYWATEQWELSMPLAEEAYAYFKQMGAHWHMVPVSKLLIDVAAKLGQYEKVYEYAKEHIRCRDLDAEKDSKQSALKLQYQLDTERKEKEFEKRLGEARLKTLAMLASEMAHEIQNPLQFVNNFSAINLELLDEQQEYLQSKDLEGIEEVRQDLLDNCGKIQEHGKRISKIVAELQDKTNKAQAGELELPTEDVHDFGKQLR